MNNKKGPFVHKKTIKNSLKEIAFVRKKELKGDSYFSEDLFILYSN